MMVEMGSDRIHHGFCIQDRGTGSSSRAIHCGMRIHDYYMLLDREIASLLELVDPAGTNLLIISDHGAKRLDGGICVNDWLRREGYLVLKSAGSWHAAGQMRHRLVPHRAWGEGGYYAAFSSTSAAASRRESFAPADYDSLSENSRAA